MSSLLQLQNLVKHFPVKGYGLLRRHRKTLKAVDEITLCINKEDCYGLAGESGSGKSTIARLVLLLEEITSGSIVYAGKNITLLKPHEMPWYRRHVQAVFQDAAGSLNPRMRIKDIISEPLEIQRDRLPKETILERVSELLYLVGLNPDSLNMFPHELSGGQKQRVAIARAIVQQPSLVILDEPVSSLDVSIRAQILNLLADIRKKQGLTYLIIAHDLAMLRQVTNQIAIIYLGKIVEMGHTDIIFDDSLHPYTKALISAIPRLETGRVRQESYLSGEISSPIDLPSGCRFHPRCISSIEECKTHEPSLKAASPGHLVACHLINR